MHIYIYIYIYIYIEEVCVLIFPFCSAQYVEVERDVCCDRGKIERLYSIVSVFFPHRDIHMYIYIYVYIYIYIYIYTLIYMSRKGKIADTSHL